MHFSNYQIVISARIEKKDKHIEHTMLNIEQLTVCLGGI